MSDRATQRQRQLMSAVTPLADKMLRCRDCPLSANSGQMHRTKKHRYSITSSAKVTGSAVRSGRASLRPWWDQHIGPKSHHVVGQRWTVHQSHQTMAIKSDVSAMAAMTRSMAWSSHQPL